MRKTSSLFNCGATIICDNDNEVNNNINTNNGTNPPPEGPGNLTVTIEIRCESTGGTPSDASLCAFTEASNDFPSPEDYTIHVTGNDPNPTSFPESSTGTQVTVGPGVYKVFESSENVNLTPLSLLLDARSINTELTVTGDCIFDSDGSFGGIGAMISGGSQECTIVNTIEIFQGTVPGAPQI